MNERDVWTVSITLQCDDDQTTAEALVVGPPVEMAGSGYVPTRLLAPDGTDTTLFSENIAAARALQNLSNRLYDRAGACRMAEPAIEQSRNAR
jgi:hypothetical protein